MATKDDANLIMQIYMWGAASGIDEAMRHVFDPEFNADSSNMMDPGVGKVLGYLETIATFVKNGLLDADLVWDLLWIEGQWARVRAHALASREESGEPRLWENIEWLVNRGATAS